MTADPFHYRNWVHDPYWQDYYRRAREEAEAYMRKKRKREEMTREPKTELTAQERIKAAYLHHVRGVKQQDIAVAFEVNSGRIAEACTAIWMAAENPRGARTKMENEA